MGSLSCTRLRIRARYPEIRTRLTTDFYGDRGFDAAEFDLGMSLVHRPGRPDDIRVLPLFPMLLTPACAPGLAAALREPADIRHATAGTHRAPAP